MREAGQMDEKCCNTCRHFSALAAPRERSDGAVIYGYCFAGGDKDYSPNMGKGFAVFIAGGACKTYAKRSAARAAEEGE